MFEHDYTHYNLSPLQSPLFGATYQQYEQPQPDDRDETLGAVTQFAALFTLGVLITLFARCFPALRPFYWIAVVGTFASLGLGAYVSCNVRLISLSVAVAIAILAGHWDFLNHQGQQAVQTGQKAIEAVQERLP